MNARPSGSLDCKHEQKLSCLRVTVRKQGSHGDVTSPHSCDSLVNIDSYYVDNGYETWFLLRNRKYTPIPHIILFRECWFFFMALEKFTTSCFAQRWMYLEYALLRKQHVHGRLCNTHNVMASINIGHAR